MQATNKLKQMWATKNFPFTTIQSGQFFQLSPAVITFDDQAIRHPAAATPAGHGPVLLWGAVTVGCVVSFIIARAADHVAEIHARNDGVGGRGGGWGRGRGRAIVVILTTHNGRLLHLQTTGVQAKRETENGDEWKWGQKTSMWNSTAVNNKRSRTDVHVF